MAARAQARSRAGVTDESDDASVSCRGRRDPRSPPEATGDRYYRGIITRVYYGSESGTLRSEATRREYAFRYPLVEIRGAIPRIDGLREGMAVGFDLGVDVRAAPRVTVIRVFD